MEKEVLKILCKACKIETNHTLEWSKKLTWGNEAIQGDDEFQVLSCNGCDSITFRILSSNSEDISMVEDGHFEYDVTYRYYPPRSHDLIEPIFEIWKAPLKVRKIYQETIDAYNNKQPILCSIGIRGIIEAICIEEKILKNNLETRINELKNKGIITQTLCDGLHESRLMGNDGAHKLEIFSQNELKTVIGLINSLIDNHYSLPEKVKELQMRASKFKKKNN